MERPRCLTPVNSLTSLEQAKICNSLLYKIKTYNAEKVLFANPAEPNVTESFESYEDFDAEHTNINLRPDVVIDMDDLEDTMRSTSETMTKLRLQGKRTQSAVDYYEVDASNSKSDIRMIQLYPDVAVAKRSVSLTDIDDDDKFDEAEKSDDEVSIMHAKEIIAHFNNYKTRMKQMPVREKRDAQNFVRMKQQDQLNVESLMYYCMLLFCLCTFCLIIVFL